MEPTVFAALWENNRQHWQAAVGAELAYWRHQRGMKQTEVAAALDVSASTLSRIECGRGYLPFDRLCGLATYLGVTLGALVRQAH